MRRMTPNAGLNLRAAIVSVVILMLLLAVWHVATRPVGAAAAARLTPDEIEYQ